MLNTLLLVYYSYSDISFTHDLEVLIMSIHYVSGSAQNIGGTTATYTSGKTGGNKVNPTNEIYNAGNYPTDDLDSQKSLASVDFANSTFTAINQRSASAISGSLKNASIYPEYLDSIHKKESARTARLATAMRAGNYNVITGKFTSVTVANDSFGNDNAARASFNVPGNLVYRIGNTTVTKAYEAKG